MYSAREAIAKALAAEISLYKDDEKAPILRAFSDAIQRVWEQEKVATSGQPCCSSAPETHHN
jgi:hypothetical protein